MPVLLGKELDIEDRAGNPEAQPDPERPEGPEPAAQLPADVREAAQTGNESPDGHQTQLREAEPRATQVGSRFIYLFFSPSTPIKFKQEEDEE